MKSQQNSAEPEIYRIRTLRLSSSGNIEPENLSYNDFFSANMNGITASIVSPLKQSGNHNNESLHFTSTPSKQSIVSSNNSPRLHTPDLHLRTNSPLTPALSTVTTENINPADCVTSPQWSSAVGRATTGKSGRVIERLMAENDRLRRELKLETLRREEEQKRGETTRSRIDSLQQQNDNLVHQANMDKATLLRRERKAEELKADLEAEVEKRKLVEDQLKSIMSETEQAIGCLRREVIEERDRAKKASSQYDVISSSWRQLDDGYRRRMERLKVDLAQLRTERQEDQCKLVRLEVTMEQQQQETSKMRVAKDAIEREFLAYKRESENGTRDMRERAERNEQANEKALQETKKVLGEMRYIISVGQNVKGAL
ncbi:MAG: hypothetical protein M1829_002397 [Trizodia sp. TS-e1964]|nr:MAG: hypothetical protein M1829_002397 [Trizodia sp. TS-e1964]